MDYRKIKDKHRVTGTGRKKWKFLEPLDQVLGDKSTTVPPVVVDTSHESFEIEKGESYASVTEENISGEAQTPLTDGELSVKSTENQSVSSDNSKVVNTPVASRIKKAKKRKNREDWIEKLVDTMADKMIAASAESDRKFIELEEKRMKFEMEEKERDERMRKEERDFQLRVFSMCVLKVHIIITSFHHLGIIYGTVILIVNQYLLILMIYWELVKIHCQNFNEREGELGRGTNYTH